jgi:hypothetical protein
MKKEQRAEFRGVIIKIGEGAPGTVGRCIKVGPALVKEIL